MSARGEVRKNRVYPSVRGVHAPYGFSVWIVFLDASRALKTEEIQPHFSSSRRAHAALTQPIARLDVPPTRRRPSGSIASPRWCVFPSRRSDSRPRPSRTLARACSPSPRVVRASFGSPANVSRRSPFPRRRSRCTPRIWTGPSRRWWPPSSAASTSPSIPSPNTRAPPTSPRCVRRSEARIFAVSGFRASASPPARVRPPGPASPPRPSPHPPRILPSSRTYRRV